MSQYWIKLIISFNATFVTVDPKNLYSTYRSREMWLLLENFYITMGKVLLSVKK
jgi:hypothetical protein